MTLMFYNLEYIFCFYNHIKELMAMYTFLLFVVEIDNPGWNIIRRLFDENLVILRYGHK